MDIEQLIKSSLHYKTVSQDFGESRNIYTDILDMINKAGYVHREGLPSDEEILKEIIKKSRLYEMAKKEAIKDKHCDLWYTFERGICLELSTAISKRLEEGRK